MKVSELPATGWYLEACDTFRPVLEQFRPDQSSWPTPCSDFDALHLISHACGSPRAMSGLVRGEPLEDIFSDILATWEDPPDARLAQFDERKAGMADALDERGGLLDEDEIAVLTLGEITWRENFAYAAYDLFIHTWDLAQALDVPAAIPGSSLESAWAAIELHGQRLRDSNMLGPELEPPGEGDSIDRIIAWSGRRPL